MKTLIFAYCAFVLAGLYWSDDDAPALSQYSDHDSLTPPLGPSFPRTYSVLDETSGTLTRLPITSSAAKAHSMIMEGAIIPSAAAMRSSGPGSERDLGLP